MDADGGGGGVIVLFTGELVFELLKGGVLDGGGVVVLFAGELSSVWFLL
jgi:hypothetical protein